MSLVRPLQVCSSFGRQLVVLPLRVGSWSYGPRVAYGASSFLARYVTGLWSHKCADQRSRAVAANATASCLSLHSGHPSPTPDGSVNPCKGGAGRIGKSAKRPVKSGIRPRINRAEQRETENSRPQPRDHRILSVSSSLSWAHARQWPAPCRPRRFDPSGIP